LLKSKYFNDIVTYLRGILPPRRRAGEAVEAGEALGEAGGVGEAGELIMPGIRDALGAGRARTKKM